MKHTTAFIFAAAAVAAAPSSASAQSFEKYYKSYLRKMVKAFETGDVKFFDAISTADFTEKTPEGTKDKASSLSNMKQQFAMTQKMTCKAKPISVKSSGSKATAVVAMKADMVIKAPDGKSHTLSMELTETENWVKLGSAWKIKSLVEPKPSKATMDGKKIDPSMLGG